MRTIWKKAVLLGASALLLAAAVFYLTSAWYTKMVSVAGMEFSAAQWDFTASHTVDDMYINVYSYASLTTHKAAPGTAGYIPIVLSASESDSDVDFRITVDKSTMSEEFQQRFRFYYKTTEDGTETDFSDSSVEMTGTIPYRQSVTVHIYWEWLYEPTGEDVTEEQIAAFNEFDTKVGQNPALYVQDMNARIRIAGAQAAPQQTP